MTLTVSLIVIISITGDVLASGSDDTRICFWDVNSRDLKSTLETGHTQNIFSVKFVPETGVVSFGICPCFALGSFPVKYFPVFEYL